MKTMDPIMQRRLTRILVPRLRQFHRSKKPLNVVMIGLLVLPLAVTIILVFYAMFRDANPGWLILTAPPLLLGLACLAFLYIAKIDECDAHLVKIEFMIMIGDLEGFSEAIANVTCFGRFGDIFDDAKRALTTTH